MRLINWLTNLIDYRQLPDRPLPSKPWPFLGQIAWRLKHVLLPIAGLNILLGILYGVTPILWKHIVDPLSSSLPREALIDALFWPVIFYIAIYTYLTYFIRYGTYLLQAATVNTSLSHMVTRQLYHYQLGQSIGLFNDEMSGRIASKVNSIASRTSSALSTLTENILRQPFMLISGLITLLFVSPWLALPIAVWAVLFIGTNLYCLPRLNRLSQLSADAGNTTFGRMVDTLANMPLVKLFSHSGQEDRQILAVIGEERQRDVTMRLGWSGFYALTEFWYVLLTTAMLLLLLWLRIDGKITTGDVVMAFSLVGAISGSVEGITRDVGSLLEQVAVIEENLGVVTRPYAVEDRAGATMLPRVRGQIEFRNVSFAYGPDLPEVLHNLSLTIPAGQKVGLIGFSGAGKTTLTQLLLRFYDPAAGQILIDGIDIASVTQESLREQIAMVTQDTALFNRSIADNIRYGRADASDAAVEDAARQAAAHDFIMQLRQTAEAPALEIARRGLWHRLQYRRRARPQNITSTLGGYQAKVGERGVKLSGGQRQRLAIARLILKDAPILILDEATSALDSEVEAAIQENLTKVMTGKTVIAIAHRLSTIARLDRLIVMEAGRIVEDGTHAELIARGGVYARLWHRQSGGFLNDADVAA